MIRSKVSSFRFPAPLAALIAGMAIAVAPLQAQSSTDGRWLPWTGCWESIGMNADASLVCVQPVEDGAELITLSGTEVASVETLVPDGTAREFQIEGCTGTRSAEFSADGERIYVTESAVCDGLDQTTVGVIAMIAPDEWIDIRGMDGRDEAFSRSYRLVSSERAAAAGFPELDTGREMTVRMMRWRNSEPSSLGDLLEVDAHVPAGVTRVWVAEQLDPFDIDADGLIRLADAGVAEDVIDVVVARSFPEQFALRDGDAYERAGRNAALRGYGPAYAGYGPGYGRFRGSFGFWSSPFYYDGAYGAYGPYRPRYVLPTRVRYIPSGSVRPSRPGVTPVPGRGYVGSGTDRSGSGTVGSSSSGDRSTGRTARRRGGGGDDGVVPRF